MEDMSSMVWYSIWYPTGIACTVLAGCIDLYVLVVFLCYIPEVSLKLLEMCVWSSHRCSLKLRLTIPTIVIDPTCEVAQDAVNEAASAVLDLTDCVNWGPGETQEGTLISTIREDKTIQHILRHINHVIISKWGFKKWNILTEILIVQHISLLHQKRPIWFFVICFSV